MDNIKDFINVDLPPIFGPVMIMFFVNLIELDIALFGLRIGFHTFFISICGVEDTI